MEELKKLEDRKRVVGSTMERTGVVFATEKRRAAFRDDEMFERFVYESDDEASGGDSEDNGNDEDDDEGEGR